MIRGLRSLSSCSSPLSRLLDSHTTFDMLFSRNCFSATVYAALVLTVLLSALGVDGYFLSIEERERKPPSLGGDHDNWLMKRMNKISCHCCANSFNSHCCIQCMHRVGKRLDETSVARNDHFEDDAMVTNEDNIEIADKLPQGRSYRVVKQVNHLLQLSPSDW